MWFVVTFIQDLLDILGKAIPELGPWGRRSTGALAGLHGLLLLVALVAFGLLLMILALVLWRPWTP